MISEKLSKKPHKSSLVPWEMFYLKLKVKRKSRGEDNNAF